MIAKAGELVRERERDLLLCACVCEWKKGGEKEVFFLLLVDPGVNEP